MKKTTIFICLLFITGCSDIKDLKARLGKIEAAIPQDGVCVNYEENRRSSGPSEKRCYNDMNQVYCYSNFSFGGVWYEGFSCEEFCKQVYDFNVLEHENDKYNNPNNWNRTCYIDDIEQDVSWNRQ